MRGVDVAISYAFKHASADSMSTSSLMRPISKPMFCSICVSRRSANCTSAGP